MLCYRITRFVLASFLFAAYFRTTTATKTGQEEEAQIATSKELDKPIGAHQMENHRMTKHVGEQSAINNWLDGQLQASHGRLDKKKEPQERMKAVVNMQADENARKKIVFDEMAGVGRRLEKNKEYYEKRARETKELVDRLISIRKEMGRPTDERRAQWQDAMIEAYRDVEKKQWEKAGAAAAELAKLSPPH